MWQGMSLRARLNALFGGLMGLALAISIGWILVSAGPRVRAEGESAVRLVREFIETAVGSLKQTSDPEIGLSHLLSELANVRHVTIRIVGNDGTVRPTRGDKDEGDDDDDAGPKGIAAAPEWFLTFVQPQRTTVRIPVDINGKSYGAIVVASNPSDESAEVWGTLVSLTLGGASLALAAFMFNIFAVNRSLAPIGKLGEAVTALEAGRYQVRVPPDGSPELVDICRKVNSLAGTLERTTDENRVLSEMLVTLQDDERRELARELHDEFGPYLFAIRAGVKSLQRSFEQQSDPGNAIERCVSLQEQIGALQQINRRVLERLRPAAMSELGLREALRALVAMWGETNSTVALTVEAPENIDGLEESLALTVYRVVQEGLTNVFRHASATQAVVRISHGDKTLRVVIKDDGIGLPDDNIQGFGLLGMRERVWALNGKMSIANAPGGGVVVEAILPVT